MGPEVFVAEGALLKLVLATDGSGFRWSEAATAGQSWSLLLATAGAYYSWSLLLATAGACYWPQLEPATGHSWSLL